MSYRILITIAAAMLAACGSSSTAHKNPDAAIDSSIDAFYSTCGHPGDMGNELGIGKFCTSLGDCAGTVDAPLCSILGDQTTHFCTKTCTSGGPMNQCGTLTMCVCNGSNQCGCTPNVCVM
jgi:hypothetical protein